jgi:hypothetical protein
LQHAQHPKIGVFLQLRAAAGRGVGHAGECGPKWGACLRFRQATAVRALFCSKGHGGVFSGVLARGGRNDCSKMDNSSGGVRVWCAALHVFYHLPCKRLSLWEPTPAGDCLCKLGS